MSAADDPRETMDDLGMMRRADLWPRWPYLYVKRRHDGLLQTGILLELGSSLEARPTVHDSLRPQDHVWEYGSLEELAADGWRVD